MSVFAVSELRLTHLGLFDSLYSESSEHTQINPILDVVRSCFLLFFNLLQANLIRFSPCRLSHESCSPQRDSVRFEDQIFQPWFAVSFSCCNRGRTDDVLKRARSQCARNIASTWKNERAGLFNWSTTW